MPNVVVVGAGLVGPITALYLAKLGYHVDVYEKRPDPRLVAPPAGRSVNIVISERGWQVLKELGLEAAVKELALPLRERRVHLADRREQRVPYSQSGHRIWAAERDALSRLLLSAAAKHDHIRFHFDCECVGQSLQTKRLFFRDTSQTRFSLDASRVIGTDGANSALRKSFEQDDLEVEKLELPIGYKEIRIPKSAELENDAFHVWPRGPVFFGAFPNQDETLTGAIYLPHQGEFSFESTQTPQDIGRLFKRFFPELYQAIPDLVDQYRKHPVCRLETIRCAPWVIDGRIGLLGDAAHAVVPFLGQGMNAGFQDARCLYRNLLRYEHDWERALQAYQLEQKPGADALRKMSLEHYDTLANPRTDSSQPDQARAWAERKLARLWPDLAVPSYESIAFTTESYAAILARSTRRERLIESLVLEEQCRSHPKSTQHLALSA